MKTRFPRLRKCLRCCFVPPHHQMILFFVHVNMRFSVSECPVDSPNAIHCGSVHCWRAQLGSHLFLWCLCNLTNHQMWVAGCR